MLVACEKQPIETIVSLSIQTGKDTIRIYEETDIIVSVEPNNATVTFYSSNESVATIEDGKVIGHMIGDAWIVAQAGNLLDTCFVHVKEQHFEHGVFVLNEGNMGSNKASIDFYDNINNVFYRNIYPQQNPKVIKELGDVGNDITIYGGKMYAVINVSGKVEVMDLNAKRINQIDIPNCRSICVSDGFVYITSYAGPVFIDPDYEQLGFVAKIDTSTLTVVDTCCVGFQPNGICTDGQYLYVANSGGYMYPNYDSTLSVINLTTFREEKKIAVAVNLDAVVYDPAEKAVYVSSLGDYTKAHPAGLYKVETASGKATAMGFAANRMQLVGERLYYFTTALSGGEPTVGYYTPATGQHTTISISKEYSFRMPYGMLVDPESGDIYLTDARDYVTPGVLLRYSSEGTLLSEQRTGDIPGHLCIKK